MKKLIILAIGLALSAGALALPNQVFVFNGGKGGYDADALGYIYGKLGFIDQAGNHAKMDANGDMMLNGQKVGSAMRDGAGNVTGYKNADGSKEAYDINAGPTANDAWKRVDDNGTFSVVKHGISVKGAAGKGGGVHLDGGTTYDGFKPTGGQGGTGVGFVDGQGNRHGPYPLDPRPGANIKIELDICYGDSDPDGDGPQKSVKDTAAGIPGVSGVTATSGKHEIIKSSGFNKGNRAQRQAAWKLMIEEARKAGFVKKEGGTDVDAVNEWIDSLPFHDRDKRIEDLIGGTGAGWGMTYERGSGFGPLDAFSSPYMILPAVGGEIGYDVAPATTSAGVRFDPGDTPVPRMAHLLKLPGVPFDFAPPGARLTSGVFGFRDTATVPPLTGDLTYWLEFWGNPRRVRPYGISPDGGGWAPLLAPRLEGDRIVGDAPMQGVVAAFEFVDVARVDGWSVERGTLIQAGDIANVDTDELVVCSTITGSAREQYLSQWRADFRVTGTPGFVDLRLSMRMGEGFPGNLDLMLHNWRTGRDDVIGRYTTSITPQVFKALDTPAADYVRDGVVQVRVKTYVGRPLPAGSFTARFDWLEVASYTE